MELLLPAQDMFVLDRTAVPCCLGVFRSLVLLPGCLKLAPLSSCSPVPAPEQDAPGAVALSSAGDLDKH